MLTEKDKKRIEKIRDDLSYNMDELKTYRSKGKTQPEFRQWRGEDVGRTRPQA